MRHRHPANPGTTQRGPEVRGAFQKRPVQLQSRSPTGKRVRRAQGVGGEPRGPAHSPPRRRLSGTQTGYTRPLKSKREWGWATLGGTRAGPPRRPLRAHGGEKLGRRRGHPGPRCPPRPRPQRTGTRVSNRGSQRRPRVPHARPVSGSLRARKPRRRTGAGARAPEAGKDPRASRAPQPPPAPLETQPTRRILHLHPHNRHHPAPFLPDGSPRRPSNGCPGRSSSAASTYQFLGDRRDAGPRTAAAAAPPPNPSLTPRPSLARQRYAPAAPPRARPGRGNTETLNTEDAQRRARGATQSPAPRPRAPRAPPRPPPSPGRPSVCSPARARRQSLPPVPHVRARARARVFPAAPRGGAVWIIW
ncbi:proline-rich protein HaeIII subfamily 1-like [Dipodomys spectabilis]|uniref:proline-rich protein HaeIII subfamily 1-like n=1 Tax=Dipodomys spectabilis TaxID=105255 RepID=UPI001C53B286|nr:proline-rich protein HaeIII subfamily 1-like [Dipodomys spectabilis]